ncbi:alpha-1,2-fucosyltransferase [Neomicrococcus lactis]
MQNWLDEFPALQDLTITRKDVRVTMPRFSEWPINYGVDFTESDLNDFLERRLLSSEAFEAKISAASSAIDQHQLTINIRRGDYYSTPFEEIYGIDIETFVAEAITHFDDFTSIRVISDDLEWCRAHTGMFPSNLPIYFGGVTPGAFGDLAALACSTKLILPNSTFSYWGGFLSDLLSQKRNKIVVPEVHERYQEESRVWTLPAWWTRVNTTSSLNSGASPDELEG